MQILVVDDDSISAEMAAMSLRSDGYTVVTAATGEEALAKLAALPIGVVLADWEMPEMDGIELCRRIRGVDYSRYVYIMLLTARHHVEDIVEALGAGADDFVSKPFEPAELAARVRSGVRVLSLETRDLMIFALAKLAESRDPETGAHLDRIRAYSRFLSQCLHREGKFPGAIDEQFIQTIYLTSPLHDIGKVGIPDHVLLKPGKLSDEEYAIMKTHVTIGAETLAAVLARKPDAHFLKTAHDIILCHHERFDGRGYPHALAGEEIPLAARVVAVADVYDALRSRRVYKEGFSHEKTLEIISQERGRHFDPQLVDTFVNHHHQFDTIYAHNDDSV